jgi:hypothetical protein
MIHNLTQIVNIICLLNCIFFLVILKIKKNFRNISKFKNNEFYLLLVEDPSEIVS